MIIPTESDGQDKLDIKTLSPEQVAEICGLVMSLSGYQELGNPIGGAFTGFNAQKYIETLHKDLDLWAEKLSLSKGDLMHNFNTPLDVNGETQKRG